MSFEKRKVIYMYCGFMKAILAVINPTYVVVEIGPEKNSLVIYPVYG